MYSSISLVSLSVKREREKRKGLWGTGNAVLGAPPADRRVDWD
jgi:hypothetical protein